MVPIARRPRDPPGGPGGRNVIHDHDRRPGDYAALLRAIHFAAVKHGDQRRKDPEASPYINHPIAVAEILARVGGIDRLAVLQAAVLHDTIEDTTTTEGELAERFGAEVAGLVAEVTDDKTLPKGERKRRQIEHAPHLSPDAKRVKIADKICNVVDVTCSPPPDWDWSRRLEYLEWSRAVVHGCRGASAALERCFDEALSQGMALLKRQQDGTVGEGDGSSSRRRESSSP